MSHHTQLLCQVKAKSVGHNVWRLEHFLPMTLNDNSFLALYGKFGCVGTIFSRCIHKMCSYKEIPGYIRSGAPLWTQKQNIFV